jgi:hypothetical protein
MQDFPKIEGMISAPSVVIISHSPAMGTAVAIRAIETYFQPPGPPTRPTVSLYDENNNLLVELHAGIGTYPRIFGTVCIART